MNDIEKLIDNLTKQTSECEWLEFKHNNYDPKMIGESICALSNGATLSERDCAYLILGINDETKKVVGTNKSHQSIKIGNEEIENWLRNKLSKNCEFTIDTHLVNDKQVILIKINKAVFQPITFDKTIFIRVGSYTKKLLDYPSKQSELWNKLRDSNYESLEALKHLSMVDVLNKLDYSMYCELKGYPTTTKHQTIIEYFLVDGLIKENDDGTYSIKNLGAILFAKNLGDFTSVERKAIRVVKYNGVNKMELIKEMTGARGYAVGFNGLLDYLEALLPSSEVNDGAMRQNINLYPTIAIREIIANCLIHQDLSMSGTGPIIEVFSNRIEVTNPGKLLVDLNRIIDNPPKSRNEKLASLMRQLKMCEELGSGWDRIVNQCDLYQIPAPKIISYDDSTKVIIYSEKNFSNLNLEDKLRTCYMHACIKHLSDDALTNSSLRIRFGLPETSSASTSRLIKEAVEKGLIKAIDATTAPRYLRYIPYWA